MEEVIDTGEDKQKIKVPSVFDIPGVYQDIVEEFAIYNDIFTKQECKDIIDYYKINGEEHDGHIGKGKIDKEIRNCRVSMVSEEAQNTDLLFITHRIHNVVQQANERHFKFDLTGVVEPMQFLEYNGDSSQHYSAHIDRGYHNIVRKLSASILLTDENEFEGGNLNFPHACFIVEPKQGSVILFPSFTVHEVMPVIKGIRNSLVLWITGPSFR